MGSPRRVNEHPHAERNMIVGAKAAQLTVLGCVHDLCGIRLLNVPTNGDHSIGKIRVDQVLMAFVALADGEQAVSSSCKVKRCISARFRSLLSNN